MSAKRLLDVLDLSAGEKLELTVSDLRVLLAVHLGEEAPLTTYAEEANSYVALRKRLRLTTSTLHRVLSKLGCHNYDGKRSLRHPV